MRFGAVAPWSEHPPIQSPLALQRYPVRLQWASRRRAGTLQEAPVIRGSRTTSLSRTCIQSNLTDCRQRMNNLYHLCAHMHGRTCEHACLQLCRALQNYNPEETLLETHSRRLFWQGVPVKMILRGQPISRSAFMVELRFFDLSLWPSSQTRRSIEPLRSELNLRMFS